MRCKTIVFFSLFTLFCVSGIFSEETDGRYQIKDVTYDIKGTTREFPLTLAVPIDKTKIFSSKTLFEKYISNLTTQFTNQRVFETATIETMYESVDENGIIKVSLTVHTKDTWNIIIVPYPKYDSNTGTELKLKIKNYNFFGSMQELNGDVNYRVDTTGKTIIGGNLAFDIPFKAWDYSCNWDNAFSLAYTVDENPEINISSGLNIAIPIGITSITFGARQSLVLNDRDTSTTPAVIYTEDPTYFNDTFYTSLSVPLYNFGYPGSLTWTPSASISTNWALNRAIYHANLRSPVITWGHSFGIGRVDWHSNFRTGFSALLGNTYTYNTSIAAPIAITINGTLTGFTSFFDRFGVYSRITGFYNFDSALTTNAGDKCRGIINSRISTDNEVTLNVDIPVRIMRVNFVEITGVSWTRFIGFEMHASPFFDMALTHDIKTGRLFSLDDGWYSGGLELIVYPTKMRSLSGRISAGFDLYELWQNGGKLSGAAQRDGLSIRELLIGIDLHY